MNGLINRIKYERSNYSINSSWFYFFLFHKISNFKKSYSIKNIFKISCLKKIKKYE